ncbi:MAG: hypothetical protein ACPGVU_22350 [Limisphaerales bacterium]
MNNRTDKKFSKPDSFAKEVGKGLLHEGKNTVKWGLGGALLGAVVLLGAGWFKFGFKVGLIGAGVGAIVGGIGAAWLYISASSFSD